MTDMCYHEYTNKWNFSMKTLKTLLLLTVTTGMAHGAEDPAIAAARRWIDVHNRNLYDAHDGRVVYPFGAGQPTLICAPERVCDIELEKGEAVSNVAVGDTVRWQVAAAASENDRPHVIIKPVADGLTTNAIITTDKRTYRLTLKSDKSSYTTALAFTYPQEMAQN
jgi:type IV secretion system protein VirB9